MKDKIIYFLEFIVSLVLLVFFQEYALNVIKNFGINLEEYTADTIKIIFFLIQVLLCVILYFIYKGTIKSGGNSFKHNFLKNLLYSVLILAIMTVVMNIFNYFIKYIAGMFKVTIVEKEYFNVMSSTLSVNYVLDLVKYACLMPFSYCVVYLLGCERLFNSNGAKIIMSGAIWAVVEAFNYGPSLLSMFFNVLPTFILGVFLSYIYSRNKNIWYPIIVFALYLIFSPLLMGYLGW